jgi:hypothetical protein
MESTIEIVEVNVSGTVFKVEKKILMKIPLFNMAMKLLPNEPPPIILQSPNVFQHFISYLRRSDYPFPEKYLDQIVAYGIYDEIKAEFDRRREERYQLELKKWILPACSIIAFIGIYFLYRPLSQESVQ